MKTASGFPQWEPNEFPVTIDTLTTWVRDQIESAFTQFADGKWETALLGNALDFLGSDFHWITEATRFGDEPVDITFTPNDMESALMSEIDGWTGEYKTTDGVSYLALDSKCVANLRNEVLRWTAVLDNVSKKIESMPVAPDEPDEPCD
jgi:hypothetical protein